MFAPPKDANDTPPWPDPCVWGYYVVGFYNHERPHEALDFATPSQRYHPSERNFPLVLPAVEYEPSATVRKVNGGVVRYQMRMIWVGKTLDGQYVALRPSAGSEMRICYGGFEIGRVNLDEIKTGHYGRARLFAPLREQPCRTRIILLGYMCYPCPRTPVTHVTELNRNRGWACLSISRYAVIPARNKPA